MLDRLKLRLCRYQPLVRLAQLPCTLPCLLEEQTIKIPAATTGTTALFALARDGRTHISALPVEFILIHEKNNCNQKDDFLTDWDFDALRAS